MSFEIQPKFFASFKINDNIVYNLRTLEILYSQFEEGDDDVKKHLRKPITLTLVSILEAILFDLYQRINRYKLEGVPNMTSDLLSAIRGKELDKLEKYIQNAKKHDLFEVGETNFYVRLDDLRKARNRIHIQNEKRHEPQDEGLVFRDDLKISAEKCLEKIIKNLNEKHPRSDAHVQYMAILRLPWSEHLVDE